MPKIARKEDNDRSAEGGAAELTKIARSTTREGADAAREINAHARTSAAEAAESGRQIVRRSAEESAEVERTILDLLGEQTRHNLQVAAAFGRPMNWDQAAEMQREFVADSFNRMNRLAERYRMMMQAGVTSMASSVRR